MLSRRAFLSHSALLGSSAGLSLSPVSQAVAAAATDAETVTWSACSINCGSRCILRCIQNTDLYTLQLDQPDKEQRRKEKHRNSK